MQNLNDSNMSQTNIIKSTIKTQLEICRLCLSFTKTCFSLIEDSGTSAMLEALTSLRILPSDDISTVMCLKCSLNLKLAYNIQQNMLGAERRFREAPIKQECDIQNTESNYVDTEPLENLQTQSQKNNKLEEHTCDICAQKWTTKVYLNKQKKGAHVQKQCPVCERKVETYKFDVEVQNSIGEEEYIIKHEPSNLEGVKLEKSTPKNYGCDICGKKYHTNRLLNSHKYRFHLKKTCPICGKELTKDHFNQHVAHHGVVTMQTNTDSKQEQQHNEGKYECDMCGKKKYTQSALRRHKYNVHVRGECPICKKTISQANLKRHIERHTDPQTVCDLCGVSVLQQDLRVHMFNNHTVRKLKCNFCEKVFKKNCDRTTHEKRDHLDEADFTCDICGKSFFRKVLLKRHIDSTHLKLRPHICEFCNVGFSSRFALNTHRRQHTNERPFKCSICGEGFRQNVSLKSHLKSQHDVTETLNCECQKCGKKFASDAALASHKRIH